MNVTQVDTLAEAVLLARQQSPANPLIMIPRERFKQLLADKDFQNVFDPCNDLESSLTGMVGCAHGCRIETDGFRAPNDRWPAEYVGFLVPNVESNPAPNYQEHR